jgi:hypothetical protein
MRAPAETPDPQLLHAQRDCCCCGGCLQLHQCLLVPVCAAAKAAAAPCAAAPWSCLPWHLGPLTQTETKPVSRSWSAVVLHQAHRCSRLPATAPEPAYVRQHRLLVPAADRCSIGCVCVAAPAPPLAGCHVHQHVGHVLAPADCLAAVQQGWLLQSVLTTCGCCLRRLQQC